MADLDLSELEKVQTLLDMELQEAWRSMLSVETGRLILWSILDKCGCFNFNHYGGELDILNRGRQQIGGELLRDFVFPQGMQVYADMLLEAEMRDKRLNLAAEIEETEDEETE